ncbi:MAG: hypothetical protein ABIA93_03015 [Candidatus Woesearchaeota archaeon]
MADIELGGNIRLAGFNELDPSEFIVVKKVVGSYARKFSDRLGELQELSITLKSVHKQEHSEKYEIHALLIGGKSGKPLTAEITEHNLFVGLDLVLKKIEALAL